MATRFRVSIFIPALLILLATLHLSSQGVVAGDDRPISPGSVRSLLAIRKSNRIPNCGEMVSNSQCSQNSKCRWCRSDALDDACFAKSEAWRLPPQVFSCD